MRCKTSIARNTLQSRNRRDKDTILRFTAASLLVLVGASVLHARAHAVADPDGNWVQQVELANTLVDSGKLDEAEKSFVASLDAAGNDHVRIGVVLQNTGRLLERKGRLLDAEKSYLRALRSFNAAGSVEDRLILRAAAGLTGIYIQTGQYAKGGTLIRRVLADHPAGADADRASLLGSLGVILAHGQRFAEAEQALVRAAELGTRDASPDMQEVRAIAIANLAGVQARSGRRAEASESYRKALSIMETLPSPSPAAMSITLADYAELLLTQGERNSAGDLYARAIEIAATRLGPNHGVLGALLDKYSEVLRRSGRKAEARDIAVNARRITEQSRRDNLTGHTVPVEALAVGR